MMNKNKRHRVNDAPFLTPGASQTIAKDGYDAYGFERENPRLTMQVIDVALLKYELVYPYNQEPCASFQNKESRSLVKDDPDSAVVRNMCRYRLQLSDGKQVIAAKFHPEIVNLTQTEVSRMDNIHDLVTRGELKKGTILSFNPHSHAMSGKGIVTIHDYSVDGWSEIVGNPQPCHSAVAAFSARNQHHCTVPLSYPRLEPLPQPILLLAKLIEEHCGYCAITGSAPLAQRLHDLPGCQHCYASRYSPAVAEICKCAESNDVDLFVPQYPEGLAHYQHTGEKLAKHGEQFYQGERGYSGAILKDLHRNHGLRHTDINYTPIRLTSQVEKGGTDYGWMRVFVGLVEKIEFRLVTSTGIVIDKPVQILIMNTFTSSPKQLWSERVTEDFDVDIAKGIAHVNDAAKLESISFSDTWSDLNVLYGKFHYSMRPCHSFPQMWKRLKKYKSRGYELSSLTFDPKVSDEWKEHILDEFQIMCARIWIQQWAKAFSLDIPEHLVAKHIMPFLKGEPGYRYSEERRVEKRDMLRAMVLCQLHSNDWYDPGHVKVDRERVEDRFRDTWRRFYPTM